jgi:hypothetical protein
MAACQNPLEQTPLPEGVFAETTPGPTVPPATRREVAPEPALVPAPPPAEAIAAQAPQAAVVAASAEGAADYDRRYSARQRRLTLSLLLVIALASVAVFLSLPELRPPLPAPDTITPQAQAPAGPHVDEKNPPASAVPPAGAGDEVQRPNAPLPPLPVPARPGPQPPPAPLELRNGGPIACWTFANDATDTVGGLQGTLKGGAFVANGRLHLTGDTSHMEAGPLQDIVAERTLEAWVRLTNLAQRDRVMMMMIKHAPADRWDGVVFAEPRQPGSRWYPGSSYNHRSRHLDGPDEDSKPDQPVHLAIVYAADNSITLFRNGRVYGAPFVPHGPAAELQHYPKRVSWIRLGDPVRSITGEIEEASLFDRALTEQEVNDLFRMGPRAKEQVWREAKRDRPRPPEERGRRPAAPQPEARPPKDADKAARPVPEAQSPSDRLADELVTAPAAKRDAVLEMLRTGRGVEYTEALVSAIGRLRGERKQEARDALTQRLARLKPETLARYLKDEEAEIRSAAAGACVMRELKAHIPLIIPLLLDRTRHVAATAHAALKELSGRDLGTDADAWKAWWARHGKR